MANRFFKNIRAIALNFAVFALAGCATESVPNSVAGAANGAASAAMMGAGNAATVADGAIQGALGSLLGGPGIIAEPGETWMDKTHKRLSDEKIAEQERKRGIDINANGVIGE